MLHYMQMKNWFLIFLAASVTYLAHQKLNSVNKNQGLRAQAAFASIFR